jgi:two-component system sensor histidine kinase DesK
VSTSPAPRSGWRVTRWANLIYLANLLWKPFIYPAPYGLDWLLIPLVVGLFIFLYARSTSGRYDTRRWFTIPVTLLGLVTTPINSGAAVLFVYAAAAAGGSETRRNALRWMLALTVLSVVAIVAARIPLPWLLFALIPPTLFIWIVGSLQLETAAGLREAAELRVANVRIEHLATVAERERIARDLHDLLGHSLTSVVVRAQLVQQLAATDPDRARTEATEIEQAARDALKEVRNAVSGWRRASIEAELESAGRALEAAGVTLTVDRDPGLDVLGPAEHELALALREAVTNVARHAHARTCRIQLVADDGEVRLVVADDGTGGSAPDGNGLAGMRERISALGGRVQRSGAAGTTLVVAVPLRVAT